MKNIIFPKKTTQRYWDIHYKYVLNIFESCGLNVILQEKPGLEENSNNPTLEFKVCIDGKWVEFDYSDNGETWNKSRVPLFKFHFKPHHKKLKNIYPFLPVCFYDWNDLNLNIQYKAIGNTVLNCQKPYAGALARRNALREILKDYPVDYSITDQHTYWKKVNNCLVSVHVPGQNNNMLDRAQLQLMAFGCCTISPKLPEILPFNKSLIPNIHYIQCNDDYSDLTDKIDWCMENREKCIEIGNNVKDLFRSYFKPEKLIEYMEEIIK